MLTVIWLGLKGALSIAVDLFKAMPEWLRTALLVAGTVALAWWYAASSTEERVSNEYKGKLEAQAKAHKKAIEDQEDAFNRKITTMANAQATAAKIQKENETKLLGEMQSRLDLSKAESARLRNELKEVKKYVTAKADAGCIITAGFVRMHNKPLAGADAGVPENQSGDVDAPSGVALSTVASTVADNYVECEERGRILKLWQDWYPRAKQVYDAALDIVRPVSLTVTP